MADPAILPTARPRPLIGGRTDRGLSVWGTMEALEVR